MVNRRTFIAAAALLLVAFPFRPAMAAKGADEFIRDMGRKAINSLTGPDLSDHERESRFRRILNDSFDMQVIARFTLGRYWRVATKDQRQEYVKLFEAFVVQAYAARFKEYKNTEGVEAFKVGNVRDLNDREKLVASEIVREGQPPVSVHWRVRSDGGYKIVDVVVEGISMGVTQRDEFASVINSRGGKIEGLLAALREKTKKADEKK